MYIHLKSLYMNEIISIVLSFNNEPHDCHLALDICRGKRPKIREETPEFLKELIQKCWDANPENRPTSEEVYKALLNKTYLEIVKLEELTYELPKQQKQNYLKHILKQFIQADFSIFQICLSL